MVKSKELSLLTWNLNDGLSDPDKAGLLAEKIAEVDPDLAILTEGATGRGSIVPSAQRLLEQHVGNVFEVDYGDFDGRTDTHKIVAVAKPNMGRPEVHSDYGRNSLYFNPRKIPVRIVGMHGYDRNQSNVLWSDETRVYQMQDVLSRLALKGDDQAIVLGKLNAINPTRHRAQLLRTVAPLLHVMPFKNPDELSTKFEQLTSTSQLLAQMAIGGSLQELFDAGFWKADTYHHEHMSSVQLSHIIGRRTELFGRDLPSDAALTGDTGLTARATIFLNRKFIV